MKKKRRSTEDSRKWFRYQFFGSARVNISKEKAAVDMTIANISFSGMGLYADKPVGKGKKVQIQIAYVDRNGKICEDRTTGVVDWQKKFKTRYLIGVLFEEELNIDRQPNLIKHLIWLIDTFRWPQPYGDKRISVI
ncbi:MAG: PilZ domain-containing protein [Thermodesulfovibrionales bacterium]|nr:PilZ domain-containing protein [Thermodesulfovibrionales bacterium]